MQLRFIPSWDQDYANNVSQNSESPVLSSRTRKEKKEETFKEETGAEDQAPGDLQRLGDGKMLPTRLIQIWTEIDPALPRENIQNIFQSTFAEFRLAAPMGNQPWMQTDDKSGVLALEKARITNGGKIPASWKAAAEQSEHGRKWLEINREQERAELAEALSRVQENVSKTAWDEGVAQGKVKTTAAQYNEMTRQAQNAIDEFKEAAKLAKQAKEAADEASEKADQARLVFLDCSAARDKARLAASSAAAELKVLEEKSQKAAEVEPPSKKRKLGVGHGDAAACDEGWGWGYCK